MNYYTKGKARLEELKSSIQFLSQLVSNTTIRKLTPNGSFVADITLFTEDDLNDIRTNMKAMIDEFIESSAALIDELQVDNETKDE